MALTDATLEDGDVEVYFNDTESSCREKCVQNCSCSGYSFVTNCTLHSTSTVLYNARASNDSVTPFMLRFQAVPTEVEIGDLNGASFRGTKLILTVVLVSVIGVVLVATLVWWLLRIMMRRRKQLRGGAKHEFSAVGLVRFSYKELVDATGNFGRQLGTGGFGAVHKGTLGDKSEVAVKTLAKMRQGEQEFRTEVAVIGEHPSQTLKLMRDPSFHNNRILYSHVAFNFDGFV